MIDDQLSPEERQLVQQIQAVAKPKLDATTREVIRQSMLSEFRISLLPSQPHAPSVRPQFSFPTSLWVAAAVVVLVVGLLILQNGTLNNTVPGGSSAPSTTPENQIAAAPTQTPTIPVVAPTATEVMALTPSISPEIIPSLTPTPAPTIQVVPSGTPVPLATPTEDRMVTIEGPVTSITDNVVTIYGFRIEVVPQHPILQIIDVGDVVRVEGVLDDGGVVRANVVSNIPDAAPAGDSRATVGLDGPVEAINGNILVVNGISIQLDPNDPLLQTIQPGSFVRVQGNFQTSSAGMILIVVNIAVVNNVSVESTCWYHVDAMGMGHWHCDGMGMGMGNDGMGMGMGEAMGMGG